MGSKVSLQSMRPNRLPVCAPLLSDGLCRSGFTKPRGTGLLDTQTHTHTQIDTHARTHTRQGKVTEAATTRCRQDRRRARSPAERRCQWADRTRRRFHAHAMIYLSALILCSDSITCRSQILYSPTTHTHTHTRPHPPLLTIQNPCRAFPRAFQARGAIPEQGPHPQPLPAPSAQTHRQTHTNSRARQPAQNWTGDSSYSRCLSH